MLRKLRMLAVVTLLLCVCQLTSIATEAPLLNLDGYWEGFVEREGAKLGIMVEFKTASDGVKAVIDIPDLYIHGYKLTNVRYESPSVRFELPLSREPDIFDGAFKGEFIEGTYSGRFYQAETWSAHFILWRLKKKPLPYNQEEVSFQNGEVKLAGTLFTPLKKGPHPAVVFFHGSGPQTRESYLHLDFYPVKLPRQAPVWQSQDPDLDFDPRPLWEQLKLPVLAIFGESDKLTPSAESARRIEVALRKSGASDYTIKIFPKAGNGMWVTPEKADNWDWDRPAPGWLDLMVNWLQKHSR